jgi:hypothetical protein
MNRTPILCALGFVLASLSPGYAQEGETLIPPEVYRAAGLDKLTDSERKVLLDWLANEATSMERGSAAAGSQPVTNSTSGESASVAESRSPVTRGFLDGAVGGRDEVTSRIVSEFSGWNGRTVFVLENGETWQQRMDGEYSYSGSDTRVSIRRGFMGLYRMELLATGRWIGVRRIK